MSDKTSLTLHYGHFMDPKYELLYPRAHSLSRQKVFRPTAMNEIAVALFVRNSGQNNGQICMAMVFWCELTATQPHIMQSCACVRAHFLPASRGSVRPVRLPIRPSAASLVFIRRRPSPPKIYGAHTSSSTNQRRSKTWHHQQKVMQIEIWITKAAPTPLCDLIWSPPDDYLLFSARPNRHPARNLRRNDPFPVMQVNCRRCRSFAPAPLMSAPEIRKNLSVMYVWK